MLVNLNKSSDFETSLTNNLGDQNYLCPIENVNDILLVPYYKICTKNS